MKNLTLTIGLLLMIIGNINGQAQPKSETSKPAFSSAKSKSKHSSVGQPQLKIQAPVQGLKSTSNNSKLRQSNTPELKSHSVHSGTNKKVKDKDNRK